MVVLVFVDDHAEAVEKAPVGGPAVEQRRLGDDRRVADVLHAAEVGLLHADRAVALARVLVSDVPRLEEDRVLEDFHRKARAFGEAGRDEVFEPHLAPGGRADGGNERLPRPGRGEEEVGRHRDVVAIRDADAPGRLRDRDGPAVGADRAVHVAVREQVRVARVALERRAPRALGGAIVHDRKDALEAPLLALREELRRRVGRRRVAVEAVEHVVRRAAHGREVQREAFARGDRPRQRDDEAVALFVVKRRARDRRLRADRGRGGPDLERLRVERELGERLARLEEKRLLPLDAVVEKAERGFGAQQPRGRAAPIGAAVAERRWGVHGAWRRRKAEPSRPPRGGADGFSLGEKLDFEIRLFLVAADVGRHGLEARVGADDLEHLGEIRRIVGGGVEEAAGAQGAVRQFEVGGAEKSVAGVAVLGPRVGEKNEKRGDAAGRDAVFQRVAQVRVEVAHVAQAEAAGGHVRAGDARLLLFDREQARIGVRGGVSAAEAPVAGAHVQFHVGARGVGFLEKAADGATAGADGQRGPMPLQTLFHGAVGPEDGAEPFRQFERGGEGRIALQGQRAADVVVAGHGREDSKSVSPRQKRRRSESQRGSGADARRTAQQL